VTRSRALAVVAVAVAVSAGIVITASVSGDDGIGVRPLTDTAVWTTVIPTIGTAEGLPTNRLLASVLQVRGLDCRTAQVGTGFVVADGLIATVAHVVAGITAPTVAVAGEEVTARVVGFDPVSDLALLRPLRTLDLPPALDLGTAVAGTLGTVLVHGGADGPAALPVAVRRLIRATGDDIYGRPADGRDALEITATIRTGHSGAPVVDESGAVIGVLFSRLRGGGSVAYAVQAGELSRLLEETANKATPTGPCL